MVRVNALRRNKLRHPPTIRFSRVGLNITLRRVISYNRLRNTKIIGSLSMVDFLKRPWNGLKKVFSQIRIKKVNIYAVTGTGTVDAGLHVMHLSSADMYPVRQAPFSVIASFPGSQMSVANQMAAVEWHPTNGSERCWSRLNAKFKLCDYAYVAVATDPSKTEVIKTLPFEMTIDAHVQLRGLHRSKINNKKSGDGPLQYVCGGEETSSS